MMKEAAERRLEVSALRQRLRQTLAAIEESKGGVSGTHSHDGDDEDDPRAVARRLAYLEDNQEAVLAATIMQRGWRYFKCVCAAVRRRSRCNVCRGAHTRACVVSLRHICKYGWSFKLEVAHRIRQRAMFRKLFFAMKDRQLANLKHGSTPKAHDASAFSVADVTLRAAKHQAQMQLAALDSRVVWLGKTQNELKAKLLHLHDTLAGVR